VSKDHQICVLEVAQRALHSVSTKTYSGRVGSGSSIISSSSSSRRSGSSNESVTASLVALCASGENSAGYVLLIITTSTTATTTNTTTTTTTTTYVAHDAPLVNLVLAYSDAFVAKKGAPCIHKLEQFRLFGKLVSESLDEVVYHALTDSIRTMLAEEEAISIQCDNDDDMFRLHRKKAQEKEQLVQKVIPETIQLFEESGGYFIPNLMKSDLVQIQRYKMPQNSTTCYVIIGTASGSKDGRGGILCKRKGPVVHLPWVKLINACAFIDKESSGRCVFFVLSCFSDSNVRHQIGNHRWKSSDFVLCVGPTMDVFNTSLLTDMYCSIRQGKSIEKSFTLGIERVQSSFAAYRGNFNIAIGDSHEDVNSEIPCIACEAKVGEGAQPHLANKHWTHVKPAADEGWLLMHGSGGSVVGSVISSSIRSSRSRCSSSSSSGRKRRY
jgi:hypothetical protein